MRKPKGGYELAVRILEVMEKLVEKFKQEGASLDEYQKAQVVQALVMAKGKLVSALGQLKDEELAGLEGRLERIEEEVGRLVDDLDMEKVREILVTLRVGLEKLMERDHRLKA